MREVSNFCERRIPFKVGCLFSEFMGKFSVQLNLREHCFIGFLTDLCFIAGCGDLYLKSLLHYTCTVTIFKISSDWRTKQFKN